LEELDKVTWLQRRAREPEHVLGNASRLFGIAASNGRHRRVDVTLDVGRRSHVWRHGNGDGHVLEQACT